ncbi:MAG: hypothetical protein AAFU79_21510, partial [Myxococcota bacterium]
MRRPKTAADALEALREAVLKTGRKPRTGCLEDFMLRGGSEDDVRQLCLSCIDELRGRTD